MSVVMFFFFGVYCRKLYWTDSFYGSIHVMELDGRYRKKLVSGDFTDGNNTYTVSRPRAVAVNPKYGYSHAHTDHTTLTTSIESVQLLRTDFILIDI